MRVTSRTFARGTLLLVGVVALGLLARYRIGRRPSAPPAAPAAEHLPVTTSRGEEVPRAPQVWAIAVGIDQYQDPEIPACHGAIHGARAVAKWFAETARWGPRNVLLMDDLGQAKPPRGDEKVESLLPTRDNLDWAFKEWLAPRLRPDDVVVVYYAGQALALPPPDDAPPGSPERQFLLPIDARSLQWAGSSWAPDEAIDAVVGPTGNPVICWLDTSLLGRGRRVDKGSTSTPSATPWLRRIARWPGVSAWLAADGKPAVEPAQVGGISPFTAALIESLGSPERPHGLHASLGRLLRDRALVDQGFRTLGGVDPAVNLWPARVRQASLARRELLLQRGHAAAVMSVAFSADGGRLISGSQDSTVKVWSATDRRLLRSLPYHMVGVNSLALSPRGDRLASGDGAGWLRVYDLVKQEEVSAGLPHDRGVDQVVFSPEGDRIASLDLDGKSWIWSAEEPADQVRPLSATTTGLAAAAGAPGPVSLVLAESDGKLRLLGPGGTPLHALDGPGGVVTSRRLASDGRLVAAGDDRGRVVVWDAPASEERRRRDFAGTIDALALSPSGVVAIASGREVALVPADPKLEAGPALAIPDQANLVGFSGDGRWLAACTASGRLLLWSLAEPGKPTPLALEAADGSGQATTFAFAPDGRRLVSGDQDGGLRTWELPDGHQRPPVLARRGQVAALSLSADARYLLQVTQDRQAQVWDLQDGRGLGSIEGAWTSGVLAPNGERAYLTTDVEGDVAAADRASGRPLPLTFARPEGSRHRFGRLALSRDGRRLAAASLEGPLACVWDAETGALIQAIRGHQDPHPITAVAFTAEPGELLTASEDGTVKLWSVGEPGKEPALLKSYALTDAETQEPVPVAAAQASPVGPRRVVAGGIDGQLRLWEGDGAPVDLGSLGRSVLAIAFTPDGRWLAAAGADKRVWLWETSRPRERLRLEPNPQHAEQVNALIAWPDSRVIASGSDDTTIRLWNPAERSLLGTLSAEQGTTDWVAYTPDGLFDSSIGGERQVTWFDNKEVLSLEQVYEEFHVFKLTDQLRKGVHPKAPAPPREAPPRLTIDPPAAPVSPQRLASLSISLGEGNLANLRVYQNGVPILTADDLGPGLNGRRLTTQVELRHGVNRFHVMAGRPGSTAVEGRSETVEIRYDGPDSPSQLHVLALGVSRYEDAERALQFADRDADDLSGYLHDRGLRASRTPGLRLVLTDREVSEGKVEEAFRKLRDRVQRRPEDTVAIFLAGHADTLKRHFYLLLPSFPFRAGADRPEGVDKLPEIPPEAVLPYAALYRNLARLGALQRVVIIDACQAEAIRDDPAVRLIQEVVDTDAHRARTAYLLAARRGEPAGEVAALAHGLMTYALLKGMGDRRLGSVPGLTVFEELPTADRDRDGVITTEELRWYTDLTVPKLAANFPQLVQRAGLKGQAAPARPPADLAQDARIQASGVSFPLVEIADVAAPAAEPTGSTPGK